MNLCHYSLPPQSLNPVAKPIPSPVSKPELVSFVSDDVLSLEAFLVCISSHVGKRVLLVGGLVVVLLIFMIVSRSFPLLVVGFTVVVLFLCLLLEFLTLFKFFDLVFCSTDF